MTTYFKITHNDNSVELLDVYHINPMTNKEILEKLDISGDEDIQSIEKIHIDEIRQVTILG